MHIAPFHFKVDNELGKHDFMGYLVYKPSRRNNQKLRVYINIGAGNDFIGELPLSIDLEKNRAVFEYDYFEQFTLWLEANAYDEEYFGEHAPGQYRNEAYLKSWMKRKGAVLRFW